MDDPQSYAGVAKPGMEAFAKGEAYAKSYMRLQSWTPELKLSWTAKLPEFHLQFLPMSIAPAPAGGVVLFGTGKAFELIASEYDAGGHHTWTTVESTRTWGVFSLAGHRDRYVLAHPAYEADIRIALSELVLE